jgi:hypothetical protein
MNCINAIKTGFVQTTEFVKTHITTPSVRVAKDVYKFSVENKSIFCAAAVSLYMAPLQNSMLLGTYTVFNILTKRSADVNKTFKIDLKVEEIKKVRLYVTLCGCSALALRFAADVPSLYSPLIYQGSRMVSGACTLMVMKAYEIFMY